MVLLRRFNPEIHHRHSIRLKGYDYSRSGYYFFTINAKNRENIFGEIVRHKIQLNEFGKILEQTWFDLPNHNQNITLDAFAIMPDHFHGIIRIMKKESIYSVEKDFGAGSEPAPTTNNISSIDVPKKIYHPLSEIIRQLKTFSARRINEVRNTIGSSVWQRDYYETIIRNAEMLNRIRKYIIENPAKFKD